jgi:hypothetical protein
LLPYSVCNNWCTIGMAARYDLQFQH